MGNRTGEKYGFDFQANKSQKIGVLRSFVRRKRGDDKEIKLRQGKKVFVEDREVKNADSLNNMMQDEGLFMNHQQADQRFFEAEPNYLSIYRFLHVFFLFMVFI